MIEKVCKWCNETIIVEKHVYFAQHGSQCKMNPNREVWIQKHKDLFKGKQISERITLKKVCPRCNSEFEITNTESEIRRNKVKNYCSDKCARARPQTDETKEKIGKSIKSNIEIIKSYENSFEEIIFEEKLSEEIIRIPKPKSKNRKYLYNYICLLCNKEGSSTSKKTKRHADCYKKVSGGYRKGSGFGKSGWYKGFYCDSSWELAFIIYHLDNNLSIERNKEGFEYVYENETHLYYPDFIINGEYYEIKNFFSDLTESKISQFPYKLNILYKEEINPYLDYTINKYSKNFISLYDGNPHNKLTNKCLLCDKPCKQKNKYCSRYCGSRYKLAKNKI